MTAFSDAFNGSAGLMNGRVSDTGQVWDCFNLNAVIDGHGRYTRDPAQPASETNGGCYSQINLNETVTSMSGTVSWEGVFPTEGSQATSCVFIYSNSNVHSGSPQTETIFQNAVHVVFDNFGVTVTTFTSGTQSADILLHKYVGGSLKTDGTIYSCGIEMRGAIMTCNCPDGSVQKCASPLFVSYRGPYLIYQCFDTEDPPTFNEKGEVIAGIQPRFESVAATTEVLPGYVPPWPIPETLGVETEPR